MKPEDGLAFGDDLPKQNPWQEDRLGFKPFAERLSKVILNLQAPNGYVIGLHGEWGSGKSTALNFVKAYLDKHNVEEEDEARRLKLIDFRPWVVSGHQDLISAFFKVLAEKLPGTNRPRWINRTLRTVRGTADPLLNAVATIAVVVDPSGGVASKAASKVAGASLNSMIDRFLTEPSLQSAYEKLRKQLESSGDKFLVTIDDLDRLQKDEIRSIMQMVKTVGRLPNVIYLLAYDRDIVWAALDEGVVVNRGSPNFAEKIVQQEVELPRPAKEDLLAILDEEVRFLTGPSPNSLRWHYLVRDGVRRWIRHPRDVLRLANAVKFSWPAIQDEIDPQDLFAMEGLRLFDEAAFDWVRWNGDFLFSEGQYLMAQDDEKNVVIKNLTDKIPEVIRHQVFHVLAALFPGQAKLFGKQSREEPFFETVKRRGIGCKAGYDAYFSLYPSSNAIPKALIDEAMGKLEDKQFLVEAINSYIDKKNRSQQPMIGIMLEELAYRFEGQSPAQPTQGLLDALFDVGESILKIDIDVGMFGLSPPGSFRMLIKQILRVWGPEESGRQLEKAFTKSQSPTVCAEVFVARARELGVLPGGTGEQPLLTADGLLALGKILLPQIERAAADGTLTSAPFYWAIVRSWKYLGSGADPKAWIETNMDASAEFLTKITMGLVGHSISTEVRSYSMSERPDPELYDLKALLAACNKHLAGKELTEDARNRISVVAEAAKTFLTLAEKQVVSSELQIKSAEV